MYQKVSINTNSVGVREVLEKPLTTSECHVSLRVNSHGRPDQGVLFLLIPFCVAQYYTVQVGTAWFQYLSSDKYTYEGPFSIAFTQFATQQDYLNFFSSLPYCSYQASSFEAVILHTLCFQFLCFHFNHFYAVKENASYTLFIGAFVWALSYWAWLGITLIPDPGKFSSSLSANLVTCIRHGLHSLKSPWILELVLKSTWIWG